MLYYWLIPVIVGIILMLAAFWAKSSTSSKEMTIFWVLFFAGIIFIFIGCIMATHHTIQNNQPAGEYVYYRPQWYSQAVDYPYLAKPLPRQPDTPPPCEYVQPVSDKHCDPCYTYTPPPLLAY